MQRRIVLAILVVGLILSAIACGPSLEAEKTTPGTTTPPPAAAPKTFAVGDTVTIGDFKITVNKTRTNTGSEFFKPAAGHIWFIVECAIENLHAKDAQTVSSLLMFELVDKDGRSQKLSVFADTKGKLDGEIGVGRKMTGEIAWEVPSGAKGLELLFKPDPFRAGQAIFKLGNL